MESRTFFLRHFRLFLKSLPAKNRQLNRHLYVDSGSHSLQIENKARFLQDFEIYLNSCKEYNVFYSYSFCFKFAKVLLERYNIATPRDMKNQIKNVSRMVGFELPESFTEK